MRISDKERREAAMSIEIGTVQTFTDVRPDKAQALKVLEEAAEVFGAWQLWDDLEPGEKADGSSAGCLMSECADVIQATCNLLAAYGVTDFTGFMEACRRRNVERGRMCPDSWEQLEKDVQRIAGGGVCGYYGMAGKPCGDCPAQRTQDNCMFIMARDVVRRARAIAGRAQDD